MIVFLSAWTSYEFQFPVWLICGVCAVDEEFLTKPITVSDNCLLASVHTNKYNSHTQLINIVNNAYWLGLTTFAWRRWWIRAVIAAHSLAHTYTLILQSPISYSKPQKHHYLRLRKEKRNATTSTINNILESGLPMSFACLYDFYG